MALLEGAGQGLAAFVLVGRRDQAAVGNAADVGDVVGAGVGGAVGTDEAGPVEREHHRQVLDRDVVDQLVVAALQEGRVDRDHRLHALAGQTAGEGHRMLLGDADVEVALGEALLELDHARALAHRRRDADQALVLRRHVAQPLTEHLREGGLGRRRGLLDAFGGVELARAVVRDRVGLGQLVAVALLGDDVQELRALAVAQVLERRDQRIEVVPVDRADVGEAELLEDGARHDHALGMFLEAPRQLEQRRRVLQHRLRAFARRVVELAAHQPRQVLVERPDRRADRHVVVVEHHQHVGAGHAGVVQRLEGHAGGHRAVADDRDGAAILALDLGRQCHAERGRDRGRRVGRAEGVVFALVAAREAADAAKLPQAAHAVAAAGQDLVRIGLVADVPDQAVLGRVEDAVQRDRQLHRPEVAGQVAAGLRHAGQHVVPQFVGQLPELGARQPAQVGRRVDGRKQGIGLHREIVAQLSRSTTLSASRLSQAALCSPLRASAAWACSRRAWARRCAASRPSTVT